MTNCIKPGVLTAFLAAALLVLPFPGSTAFGQDSRKEIDQPPLFVAFSAPLPDVTSTGPAGTTAHTIGAVNALRKDHPGLIYIHGGSSLGISILSNYDKGVHVIELINMLAPDAYIASMGDYAYGDDQISIRTREAAFPIISVNSIDRETGLPAEGLLPSVVVRRGNYLVGIIGSISPVATSVYEAVYTDILDPVEAIRDEAARLKQQGTDLIIAVIDTRAVDPSRLLGPGINVDAVFQDRPGVNDNDEQDAPVFFADTERGDILFVSAQETADGWTWQSDIMSQTDFEPDPEAVAMIGTLSGRFERIMSIPVTVADVAIDTREPFVRTQESGFANVVADILREETDADIALVNSGQIRGATTYAEGDVLTRKAIQSELPFMDAIVTLELSGQTLIDALEHSVSEVQDLSGQFLQVSNLSYGYDPREPPGRRLTFARYQDSEIDPETQFAVSMPNFIAEGGDGYTMFTDAPRLYRDESLVLWERVINNLRTQGDVSFRPSGRIVVAE